MTLSANFEISSFEDILKHTAQIILKQHHALLPDLQSINVIIPNANASDRFRKLLLAQLPKPINAIIPPWVGTLKDYLANHSLAGENNLRIISDDSRCLLFIETLDTYPDLYNSENKWQVTTSLLTLFDELYLANPDILNLPAEQWLSTLKDAYNITDNLQHLRTEATLIRTLWLAWQQQLNANGLIDPTYAYVTTLALAQKEMDNEILYFVTTTNYSPVENAFIEKIKTKHRCSIMQYNSTAPTPDNHVHRFIESAFDIETPLLERLKNISLDKSDVHFSFFPANSDESEANAVDFQIRKWLLSGKTNIGIVCENRKLSRRIRALLERANVSLQDLSGWSLATTSAAAVLESWLQCIEEDFDHKAMLDLIKSHFFMPESERDFHKQAVYRLEHDIILHENISANLSRYKNQLQYRASRLNHWHSRQYDHVEQLLNTLEENAAPLLSLFKSKQKHCLSKYIDELLRTLDALGITDSFSDDDAGISILECLGNMQNALTHCDPKMQWSDFRTWLALNMESKLFIPATDYSPVSLLTLKQSELMNFDALIIAAADNQHFPGSATKSPFFNQGVRSALNLSDWKSNREQRLNQFKTLLSSADDILITFKQEEKGETVPLSPWITALKNNFHLISGSTLTNQTLVDELHGDTAVTVNQNSDLPKQTTQPSVTIPETLIPSRFSARSHQSIINCPYMYFSEDALSLKPAEEISDELQKSDYGRLIHRVLQIFHQSSNDKLKPFTEKLTPNNKNAAIDHLNQLSETLFKRDLESNALHKSWLHRWKKQIPSYINWQINHQKNWDITATEQQLSIELENDTILFGRIDRIDSSCDGQNKLIIDYKTGKSAKQETVDTAEDVQLISYALLNNEVKNVFYLNLDDAKRGVKQGASLSGETLETLKIACTRRLNDVIQMTHDGHSLTAWGDETVCAYCKYDGICRKPFWSEN